MRSMKRRINNKTHLLKNLSQKYYINNLKLSDHAKARYNLRVGGSPEETKILSDIEKKLVNSTLLFMNGNEFHYGVGAEIYVIKRCMINCEMTNLIVTVMLTKTKQLLRFADRVDQIDYVAMGCTVPLKV